MRKIIFCIAAATFVVSCASYAANKLTTRQMATTGTPTTIPATASNGTSDSVARVDHKHNCATATSTQPGCLSAADWIAFAAKESVLSFGDGLSRTGDAVSCVDAGASAKGCVTTTAQEFLGDKTFLGLAIAAYVRGNPGLTLASTGTGALTLSSATGTIGIAPGTTEIKHGADDAHAFTFNIESKNPGRNTFVIDNSGGTEEPYFATDLDIKKGRLKVCSVDRIDCDGNGTFTSLSANSWGSHGHTDASSGGTLSASAIASGTLPAARGGTGLSAPTSDAVMVGNGSAWEAKALTDCDATGSVMQFDTTTNAFSCATRGGWATLTVPTGYSWVACTEPPQYRKETSGRVTLRGCVKSGDVGHPVAVLPSGYRPAQKAHATVASLGEVGNSEIPCGASIGTDGSVVVSLSGICVTTYGIYLDGVSFFTD